MYHREIKTFVELFTQMLHFRAILSAKSLFCTFASLQMPFRLNEADTKATGGCKRLLTRIMPFSHVRITLQALSKSNETLIAIK